MKRGIIVEQQTLIFVFVIIAVLLFAVPAILIAADSLRYDKCGIDVNTGLYDLVKQFGSDRKTGHQAVTVGDCVQSIVLTNNWAEVINEIKKAESGIPSGMPKVGEVKCDVTKPAHILVFYDYSMWERYGHTAENPKCISVNYGLQFSNPKQEHMELSGLGGDTRIFCFRYQAITDSEGVKVIRITSPATKDDVVPSITECT